MLTIINANNCTVEAGPDGTWVITKASGTDGAADASAVSDTALAGDFVLRARSVAGAATSIGVSPDPSVDTGYASIRCALQLSGIARVYENGIYRSPGFTVNVFAWIRRTGATIDYLSGPDLASAVIRKTASDVVGPLFFDSSLLSLGSSVEVQLSVTAAVRKRVRQRLALGLGL